MFSFIFQGSICELLYSLYVCKEISKTEKFNLHIKFNNDDNSINEKNINYILPLLKQQTYINEITYSNEDKENCLPLKFNTNENIKSDESDIRNFWYNLSPEHLPRKFQKPIIKVQPNYQFKNRILFSYVENDNSKIDFNLLEVIKDSLLFVGTEKDYKHFTSKYFKILWLQTDNLLDMAEVIAGVKGIIGCNNEFFALAECMKTHRILLSHPNLFKVCPIGGWNEVAETTEKVAASINELIVRYDKEKEECPVCGEKTGAFAPARWNSHSETDKFTWRYYKCPNCGCNFLNDMKKWTPKDYSKYIYNENYINIDPGFGEIRSRNFLSTVIQIIKHFNIKDKILDYGGGDGSLVRMLKEQGFEDSYSYDPYGRKDVDDDAKDFNIVVAIEVLEHSLEVLNLWKTIYDKLKVGGIFAASTKLCDDQNVSTWQYAHPRAGHCLLYSKKTLLFVAQKFNFKLVGEGRVNINENIYIFRKQK